MPIDVKVRNHGEENGKPQCAEICVDGGYWHGPFNGIYAHGENFYRTYAHGKSWESWRSGAFTVWIKLGNQEAVHTLNADDFPKGCDLRINGQCIQESSGKELKFNISDQIKLNAKRMLTGCGKKSATAVYHAPTHTLFIADKGPITLDREAPERTAKLLQYPPEVQKALMEVAARNQIAAHAQLIMMMAQRGVDVNAYMVGCAIKGDFMLDPNSYTINNGAHQQMHKDNQTASSRGIIDFNGFAKNFDQTWGSQEQFHGQGDPDTKKEEKGIDVLDEKRASENEYAMMCHALHNQRYVDLDDPRSAPGAGITRSAKCTKCKGLGVVFEERARGHVKIDINIDGKGQHRLCSCDQCSTNFRKSDDLPYRIYDATFHDYQIKIMYPGIAYNDLR